MSSEFFLFVKWSTLIGPLEGGVKYLLTDHGGDQNCYTCLAELIASPFHFIINDCSLIMCIYESLPMLPVTYLLVILRTLSIFLPVMWLWFSNLQKYCVNILTLWQWSLVKFPTPGQAMPVKFTTPYSASSIVQTIDRCSKTLSNRISLNLPTR